MVLQKHLRYWSKLIFHFPFKWKILLPINNINQFTDSYKCKTVKRHYFIYLSQYIWFIADHYKSISMLFAYMMEMQVSCVLLLMGYAFICGIHRAHVCSKRSCSPHPAQQMRVVSRCVFSFWTALILQQASSVHLELFKPIKGSS